MGSSNAESTPIMLLGVKRSKKLSAPTVLVSSAAGMLIRPTHESPAAAARFECFIKWTLSDAVTALSPPQLTIAAVLAFEGFAKESDLLACLSALPFVIRRNDDLQASWMSNDVVGRRNLSAMTALALAKIDRSNLVQFNWGEELKKFKDTLHRFYPGANKLPKSELLTQALHDASAWLYLHCPMACYAYLSGQLSLSLLPDSVHDRRSGRRVHEQANSEATTTHDPLAEAKDLAIEKAFDDARPTSHSRWIVQALKTLVSVTSGVDGIRSADYLARDKVRQRLGSVCTTMKRNGSPVDALLLAWVLFLLESGSVRLRNPKVSTIARYVHAIVESVHSALNRLSIAPSELDQGAWEGLFKDLLAADYLSNEARCALASFHFFLVSEFGLDPSPWLFVGAAEISPPVANVVWPHEIARAFDLITNFGLDPRLRQMMAVMLALGADNKMRIGEIRSLRLSSLQKYGDDLLLQIAPRRSHHQGKSESARRILNFSNAEHRIFIEAWLQRRYSESAESGDLLFGDPHQPQKGYKLGACQRLLNQILRSATGDSSVSFHALRHSVICREVLQTLMTADVHHSISPIHKTAAESGLTLPVESVSHNRDHELACLG